MWSIVTAGCRRNNRLHECRIRRQRPAAKNHDLTRLDLHRQSPARPFSRRLFAAHIGRPTPALFPPPISCPLLLFAGSLFFLRFLSLYALSTLSVLAIIFFYYTRADVIAFSLVHLVHYIKDGLLLPIFSSIVHHLQCMKGYRYGPVYKSLMNHGCVSVSSMSLMLHLFACWYDGRARAP